MSGLQVFEFGGRKVRTAGTADAPLFCASDVCEVLGYADISQACERLDQDEVEQVGAENGSRRVLYVGPNANMFVTESGLFSLILGSVKDEAKAFKKWVTSEVLPEIRKRGYYDAIEVSRRKQTEQLLAACFPLAPAKAKPIFSDLISALLKMRNEAPSGNPPWAQVLAQIVYDLAIPINGQQSKRRALNGSRTASRPDHSMFSDELRAHVEKVAFVGAAMARNSHSWDEWRARMDSAFRNAPLQLSLLTPVRRLPPKRPRKKS